MVKKKEATATSTTKQRKESTREKLRPYVVSFTNILDFADNFDPETTNLKDISVRLQILNDKFERMEPDLTAITDQEQQRLESLYFEARSKLESIVDKYKQPTSQVNEPKKQVTSVKLPKLNIPQFTGKIEDWDSFQQLFSALVDQREDLSAVEKFQYLKTHLVKEPLDLIQPLPVTSENYDSAWKKLSDRYANPKRRLNTHLNNIFHQKPIPTNNATALKTLLDATTTNLQALLNLGYEADGLSDPILVFTLTSKLDNKSRELWEHESEHGTFSELTTFIERRIQILEALSISSNTSPSTESKPKPITQRDKKVRTLATSTTTTLSKLACGVCNETHRLLECESFMQMQPDERYRKVRELNLCSNCLGPHQYKLCTSTYRCKTCAGKHHTLLHQDRPNPALTKINNGASTSKEAQPYTQEPQSKTVTANATTGSIKTMLVGNRDAKKSVILPIVSIIIECGHKSLSVQAILDSTSTANFITTEAAKLLGASLCRENYEVSGIGGKVSNVTAVTEICVKSKISSYTIPNFTATVIDQITSPLSPIWLPQSTKNWLINNNIILGDQMFGKKSKIDVLIGGAHFFELMLGEKCKVPASDLYLLQTRLGSFLSGSVKEPNPKRISCHLSLQINKFWELEEIPSSSSLSKEEKFAEDHFRSTVTLLPTGRFQVGLPFKNHPENLGNTNKLVCKRLQYVINRLNKDPSLSVMYNEFLDEYLKLGHMSFVSHHQLDDGYYIPHHPVLKPESMTTKLRVVFDATAKCENGLSLNDTLAVGPTIQPELFDLILKFRSQPVVLLADIEKMYRQVLIRPSDRKFQRIWWTTGSYELNTITYGTACAPFLATRVLAEIATRSCNQWPDAAKTIAERFYVDDLVTGADSVENAIKLQEDLRLILESHGFHLRKWSSNILKALKGIPPEDIASTESVVFGTKDAVKMLGLKWIPTTDVFCFNYPPLPNRDVISKRLIFSDFCKLFDPLGLCSPIVVQAKTFIQQIWTKKLEWDSPITDEQLIGRYHEIRTYLEEIQQFSVPRATIPDQATDIQLHGFCDASITNYAAVIYIRSVKASNVTVRLLCSKTKVAPVKQISIAKLELCGATLLATLMDRVCKILAVDQVHLWTDSTIVLHWLKKLPRELNTFIANRVGTIQQLTEHMLWHHVRSRVNSADTATRVISAEELREKDLWWHGPKFLHLPENAWPTQKEELTGELPELKETHTYLTRIDTTYIQLFDRFSSYTKLLRSFTYIYRFIFNCRSSQKISGSLTVEEINDTELSLIQLIQQASFPDEYYSLQHDRALSQKSGLLTLNPFLDENFILRVGGRLSNSELSYQAQHPIILPSRHPFTNLIIRHYHFKNSHAGPQLTHNLIRQKFWLYRNGRENIRSLIRKCVTCRRYNAKPIPPLMGDLPEVRVTQAFPFHTSGLDYAGPYTIRTSRKARCTHTLQIHILIFVCFSVKAIHIEIVEDLTTATFIAALRRFVSRRGIPAALYSDNAKTFIGADRELRSLFEFLRTQQSAIETAMSNEGIQWHFIPPRSPHQGGLWEAAVKSFKNHLKRVVGNQQLTLNEMLTLISQIEACLNSRPMFPCSLDDPDHFALTPAHFLIGRPLGTIPDIPQAATLRVPQRWRLVQNMLASFWSKWHLEYLNSLQQRSKWQRPQPNLQVHDVVIVKEENIPPARWVLGRISKIYPAPDGQVRVVDVQTPTDIFRRTTHRLIPLLV